MSTVHVETMLSDKACAVTAPASAAHHLSDSVRQTCITL